MLDYLDKMLNVQGLPPHGFCLLWDPTLIWTHVVSDLLIGLSYFSIPIVMAVFVMRRGDVQFRWAVWMFAAFIMACGATHLFAIYTLWVPAYGIQGLIKAVTALVSVGTAVALWPLLPRAVALPSPAQLALANATLNRRMEERNLAFQSLQNEVIERERVEAMLRQAQKMEAVGQLTGGIAHDFNNLLTIVVANLERAERLTAADPRIKKALDSAMQGANRAARLTHQLLAFSRQQSLQAEPSEINVIVSGMSELITRTLGPEVRLRLDLDPAAGKVLVDVGQTENAILNLALNARDAMPAGGHLTLATRAANGRTCLMVSDTGTGMAPEVIDRVFEPFFTTKAVGKGSGLGLSQVYGFTKQSGGEVDIESRVGEGTTMIISLPTFVEGAERDHG
ncbi:MAG: hypothetical protein RIS17_726 [Pseudomonadota bacterium]|jgi:signal transduction histidine kinase